MLPLRSINNRGHLSMSPAILMAVDSIEIAPWAVESVNDNESRQINIKALTDILYIIHLSSNRSPH